MIVKRDSIWDQLYIFPNQYAAATTNICVYTRGILRGIAMMLMCIIFGVVFSILILYPYFIGVLTLVTGQFIPFEVLFSVSIGIQSMGLGIFLTSKFLSKGVGYPTLKRKEPTFLTIWYRSIKEKTCFIIEREY